jgi:hypothetical protein
MNASFKITQYNFEILCVEMRVQMIETQINLNTVLIHLY